MNQLQMILLKPQVIILACTKQFFILKKHFYFIHIGVVWISHRHPDHHLGVARLVEERLKLNSNVLYCFNDFKLYF